MTIETNKLLCYKKIALDPQEKQNFFLQKHSTEEGTWGKLYLHEGVIDFVFLNGQGQEGLRTRMDEAHPTLIIPPAAWHKIIPVSDSFKASLEFYCLPQRYFKKKYNLNAIHGDLLYVYQTYLQHLQKASILDVGCGSGRNLLYLAKMGHHVKGLDHNQAAIEGIKKIAQQEMLPEAITQLHDLNQPLPAEHEYFDLILSTVTLQFLKPERIPSLLTELQQRTKSNGYHFLVFPIQSETYPLPELFTYLPAPKELYHYYQDSGWSVLEYTESTGHLHKQDTSGKKISGLFALLLAQKNG